MFYLQNAADIGTLTWSEIPELLHGAWMFDTASILYINALFILLSLLPLRLRERKWYQRMLFWLYTPDGALKGADTRVTQQIDLMPTLLGLVGYDRPYFAFGRDVLRENDRPAMAVNRMGENYQAITDSLVLFFDGHKTLSAYTRADTLQKHNIAVQTTPALEQVERDLKARLQQYYQHVEKSDYLVKEHNEKP